MTNNARCKTASSQDVHPREDASHENAPNHSIGEEYRMVIYDKEIQAVIDGEA